MGMDEQPATQLIEQAVQMASQVEQPPQEEIMMNGGEKKYTSSYATGGTHPGFKPYEKESIEELKKYLKHYGLTTELETLDKKSDKKTVDEIAGKLQTKIIEKNPELVVDYMLNVADPNNKLISMGYKTRDELKKALEEGKVTKGDIQKGFNDKMWWYRAPIDDVKKLPLKEYEAKMKELEAKGISQGNYKYEYNPSTGKYIRYESDDSIKDVGNDVKEGYNKGVEDKKQSKIDDLNVDLLDKPRLPYIVPMPFNLPPSALQAHFKKETTPYDEEGLRIAANIQPILDTQAANINMSEDMPIGLRMAMASNIGGTSAKNVVDYLSKTDQANLMNAQAVEGRNVERWGRADIINQQYMEDYERNSLTAKAKTDNDIHNYFAAQDSNRLKERQYRTNRALIEGLFENVRYDPSTGQMKSTTRGAKFDV
jgi:hypothetical protein